MIEVIKTSDKEEICNDKLFHCIENSLKCVLIVNSNDFELAVSLKKKHILMDTFVEEDYCNKDSLLFSFPNVHIKKKDIPVRKSDLSDFNIFIGVIELDLDNLDRFSELVLKLHQSFYYSKSNLDINYSYVVLSKQSFLVSRCAESDNLFENGILNLIPKKYYNDKGDYTMMLSHGLALLSHTSGDKYKNLFKELEFYFIDFFTCKGLNISTSANDILIDNKKFFGGAITNGDNFTQCTNIIITEFEPEKDFFYNVLKYKRHYQYTGLFDECNFFTFDNFVKFVVNCLINTIYRL